MIIILMLFFVFCTLLPLLLLFIDILKSSDRNEIEDSAIDEFEEFCA